MDEWIEITCPHCFEPLRLMILPAEGELQDFVVDCEVCCRPIHIHAGFEDSAMVDLRVESDLG